MSYDNDLWRFWCENNFRGVWKLADMMQKEPSFIWMLPLSYIDFVPVKQKYARVIIMSSDFHACEKNFKMYKNVTKGAE